MVISTRNKLWKLMLNGLLKKEGLICRSCTYVPSKLNQNKSLRWGSVLRFLGNPGTEPILILWLLLFSQIFEGHGPCGLSSNVSPVVLNFQDYCCLFKFRNYRFWFGWRNKENWRDILRNHKSLLVHVFCCEKFRDQKISNVAYLCLFLL